MTTAAASVSRFELDPDKDVSYINLTVLDASKTVAMDVKDKLRENSHRIRFPAVKRIAAKEKVQDKIASKVGQKVTPTVSAAKEKVQDKISSKVGRKVTPTVNAAKEKVQDKIASKVGRKVTPTVNAAKEKVQDKIASGVGQMVTPTMVARGLSEKMPNLLMYAMHQKAGMTIAARTAFVGDAYVVIEFQVKHIDSQTLLAKVKEDEDEDLDISSEAVEKWRKEQEDREQKLPHAESGSSSSSTIINSDAEGQSWKVTIANLLEYVITKLLPDCQRQSLEHETLPAVAQTKITEQMGAILERKLAEKQLEADIAVLSGATQARYFYSNLKNVRERNSSISSLKRAKNELNRIGKY